MASNGTAPSFKPDDLESQIVRIAGIISRADDHMQRMATSIAEARRQAVSYREQIASTRALLERIKTAALPAS